MTYSILGMFYMSAAAFVVFIVVASYVMNKL